MVITAIFLLGLVLRLINLNQSLWLDEAVQAVVSQGSFANIFVQLRGDFHPPLYHILMWAWVRLFGSNEVVLRLPSVLFGVGTVWVVYKIALLANSSTSPIPQPFGLKILNPKGFSLARFSLARLAALLLAIAPYHVYYSQEARMYAMVTFFAALSMYYFFKIISSNYNITAMRPHVSYVVFTTFMLYSDYYGFLVLLAQALAAVILARKKFFSFFVLQFFCLLLFLPVLPVLFTQLKTGLQATSNLPNWANLVNVTFVKALPLTFVKFSIGRITIFDKKLYVLIGGVLFLVYGSIIAKGFLDKKKYHIPHTTYHILFLWLVVPVLVAWLLSLFVPNYQPFRLLLALPAFNLLLAIGISSIKNKAVKFLALSFILLTFNFSLLIYYTNSFFHREDWRGVVRFIESRKEPSLAILPSATSNWPWRYYSKDKVKLISVSSEVKEVGGGEVSNLTMEQFNNGTMIYFIRYLVPLFDPQELVAKKLAELGYDKIKEVSFNQIPIWIYAYRD